MAFALYDPEFGYYRQARKRVGREPQTDFITATSSGPIFGELVIAAATQLLRRHGADPAEFACIEIGAEPTGGALAGLPHPFASYRALGLDDAPDLQGPCLVFSNELFDAQPCRRLVRHGGSWRELGVAERDGRLVEVQLGPVQADWLPAEAPEGYHLDAPRAAAELAARLAHAPWHGLFLAFDYGKSWVELATDTPGGSVRAYYRHTQSNALLDRPGEQDLTCHICWDWMQEALAAAGCTDLHLQAQEAFFVQHAAAWLEQTLRTEAPRFSTRKQSLLQLLHPAHLGRKFQALHAWRAPR